MSTWSYVLLGAGAVALVLAAAVPSWDTPTLPKRAVKRRVYWVGTAAGVVLVFLGGLPDLQSSVAFVVAALILMVGSAYFRTPNIKIGGTIYSAYEPHRQPDPPPAV
ncbi:hypothetical protein PDG61_12270 [Mycolicibacterium sp. BiH015]|uniref:hypothetical protein n=1 Tax=Mycolicibacterium sp. BiH015 TaxID=3018808 RepID=UPI0022E2744A|nr:hypothetical protein [Mycolicibacterium sp. BiH015]MDA2891691.1 hypothetical protein [Mycolicibacterium sp. BiH015]